MFDVGIIWNSHMKYTQSSMHIFDVIVIFYLRKSTIRNSNIFCPNVTDIQLKNEDDRETLERKREKSAQNNHHGIAWSTIFGFVVMKWSAHNSMIAKAPYVTGINQWHTSTKRKTFKCKIIKYLLDFWFWKWDRNIANTTSKEWRNKA